MRTTTGRGVVLGAVMTVWLGSAGPAAAAAQDPGRTLALQGNGRGAQACETCHGVTGAGEPAMGAPRLSILSAGYMAAQLKAFREGLRENPLMTPVAEALSAEEDQAVSEYYAGIGESADPSADRGPGTVPDTLSGDTVLGRRLVDRGDWSRTIPACVSCHGPAARGVDPGFPALAGQHGGYLLGQLAAWREGRRSGDPLDLMGTIAKRLTDEEIRAVAAYLASLDPGGGTGSGGAEPSGSAARSGGRSSSRRSPSGRSRRSWSSPWRLVAATATGTLAATRRGRRDPAPTASASLRPRRTAFRTARTGIWSGTGGSCS